MLVLAGLTAALTITIGLFYVMLNCLRTRLPQKGAIAVLHSIGTANPTTGLCAADFLRICDTLGYPPELRAKMDKIVAGAGIDTRFPVCPAPPEGYVAALDEAGARAALWEAHAPALAVAAARQSLAGWRHGSACDVTHVVVHSCTGFSAPGLDFALIKALGLPSGTRKLGVNFMGCFGGMTALYVAKQIIEADATGRAVVLVACAETCTVHVSASPFAECVMHTQASCPHPTPSHTHLSPPSYHQACGGQLYLW
jgi:predicted naringenin-chalcone synthase